MNRFRNTSVRPLRRRVAVAVHGPCRGRGSRLHAPRAIPGGCSHHGGLTLIELLIAMSIMAMVVGALGTLAHGVQLAFEYTEGRGLATQHARVVLDRIARHVEEATASGEFPGFLVVPAVEGGGEFPEVLVVWHPNGQPADPDGLPRYNELVIYAPNVSNASQLLEMTAPQDNRTVPPISDMSRWRSELSALRGNSRMESFALTNLLRMCSVSGTGGSSDQRGAVRFHSRVRPSEADWAAYKSGEKDWTELPWVQGVFGSQTGLRQAALQIEFQLMPGDAPVVADTNTHGAVPFFGAAALYYQLER
ncbi:MAG: prepilin-type N-terminal cleavage/methylation domain-containing protein [Thermoguttaceae bacterium]|nr:prepilin-type N-terminal cleavage/methylation domain-containing protein [Thermoguttaceae bacterium]